MKDIKMNIEIINKKKKEEIESFLEKNYGMKMPKNSYLVSTSKNRLRIFTGNLTENDIRMLNYILTIDSIGLYFGFFNPLCQKNKYCFVMSDFSEHSQKPLGFLINKEMRISFDASTLFGKTINKNVFEINEKQKEEWLNGHDLNYDGNFKGYIFIKHKNDILGMGKAIDGKIMNFVPKERREFSS